MSEEILVRQGAPTLAGIKTGSLFPCPCEDREALLSDIRKLNRRLSPKGLCLLPLRFLPGQALLYLYRPAGLRRDLRDVQASELLRQAVGEYSERFKASRLSPVIRIGVPDCTITADGRLLWRVFDNLLGNIVKYALPGTRVYLDLSEQDGKTLISIKNISKDALNIDTDELMERFVRGDAARAGEGSGLGLSIARSLTECMGGAFELAIDGDLFKATLTFDGPKGSAA